MVPNISEVSEATVFISDTFPLIIAAIIAASILVAVILSDYLPVVIKSFRRVIRSQRGSLYIPPVYKSRLERGAKKAFLIPDLVNIGEYSVYDKKRDTERRYLSLSDVLKDYKSEELAVLAANF